MKFYSVEEVAEILGVSRMSVYRYIDEGKLKAIKLRGEEAGRIKVAHDALVEYIRENTTTEMIFKMKRKREEVKRILKKCLSNGCNCAIKESLQIICDVIDG